MPSIATPQTQIQPAWTTPRRITPRPGWRARPRRVLWINDRASRHGGCEAYTLATVRLLGEDWIRSTLLYDPNQPTESTFLRAFEGAFPAVDIGRQVEDLDPDVIFVQRCEDARVLRALLETGRPVVRFYHDHRLFCLREHKYRARDLQTCTRTTGLGCYACPGFVSRGGTGRLAVRWLGALRREQGLNRELAGWVVASQYMKEHLIDHGFDPSRIHVAPLFTTPPVERYSATRTPVERASDQLLFVGQLTRGKGLDLLLDAVSGLNPKPRLIIAGDGPQEAEYRARATDLGLDRVVSFIGRVAGDRLDELYRTSTALVLPSRAPETFGLVGIEAMSHGTPVVAARVGGIGEWLREGVTGLAFASGRMADLRGRLATVLDHPALTRRLGEAAREYHAAHFRPEYHKQALLSAFGAAMRDSVTQASEAR